MQGGSAVGQHDMLEGLREARKAAAQRVRGEELGEVAMVKLDRFLWALFQDSAFLHQGIAK